MKFNICLSDYNDIDAYYNLRNGSDFFNHSMLKQQVIVNQNSKEMIINLDIQDTNNFAFLDSNHNKFILGENLLNFCYLPLTEIAKDISEHDFEISNTQQLFIYLKKVFGLDTAIARFIPTIKNDFKKGFSEYLHYLCDLQREYLKIIEFCFDVDFCPTELKSLSSLVRLYLYKTAYARPFEHTMNKTFSRPTLDTIAFSDNLVKRLMGATKKTVELLGEDSTVDEKILFENEFEIKHKLPAGMIEIALSQENLISFHYKCENLEEFLFLEFANLCEIDFKIKKCNRCGKYFTLKGNYTSDYCDRKNSSGRTCQQISASEKYKQKTQNSNAWNLYSKYYKRYFARMKVGTIKEDKFKQWQYKATTMRDDCYNGNITEKEFEDFCYDSFPNR